MLIIEEGQCLPNSVRDPESGLTLKQEMFCQQVMLHGNASLAYRRAYNCAKMKDTTISRNAHELKQNSKIATRLVDLISKYIARQDIDPEILKNMAMNEARNAKSDSARISAVKLMMQAEQMLVSISKNITDDASDEELAMGIAAAGYDLRARAREDLKECDKPLYDMILAKLKLT